MKNKFEIRCQYCGNSWQINYMPNSKIFCPKCTDSDLKIADISQKVDYYIGCPPFPKDDYSDGWPM